MTTREDVIDQLAGYLASRDPGHPLRVGIDGRCGSGKSTLAGALAAAVAARGRPAIHLDSDKFHHTRAIRYRLGRDSARGYYEDAYDFEALAERSLVPLGPDGSRRYAVAVHDLGTDDVVDNHYADAPPDAVVLFDCTFLQRGDLRDQWDEVIYLDVPRSIAVARGVARDADALGGPDAALAAHENRYMAACDIYEAEERPAERASVVVEYADPARPRISRMGER